MRSGPAVLRRSRDIPVSRAIGLLGHGFLPRFPADVAKAQQPVVSGTEEQQMKQYHFIPTAWLMSVGQPLVGTSATGGGAEKAANVPRANRRAGRCDGTTPIY